MRVMLPFLLLLSPLALAADFGEPMPEGEAIGIAAAAADPAAYTTGEPAKFSGRITQVCQKKGCWVVLEQDGASARVMAKDHGFEVPKDSTGPAVAYGILQEEPISEEHARHLVEDDGAAPPAAKELRIIATSISIPEA
ncbi:MULTISPECIES: DUF4920 domain-containing protein [unclassified Arenimonas]|uniref:DUF4920 domain-containing protein n=1 Tax=unclassified Arenimonas TaxID=2641713 RepID=UPI00086DF318|nr:MULTISPECIES: DUF4920 domain-containing protein [unclassified Arenimonas]ODS61719.1 MAG: hypothetical protein ABS41_12075 [Arenimonas sp. SCN 70-307]